MDLLNTHYGSRIVFDDITTTAIHSALNGLSARQRAIADNISNIHTPHFIATKVEFEAQIAAAVRAREASVVAPSFAKSLEPTREDGNNVNLDRETLSDIDAGLRYQLMTRAMDAKLTGVRTAFRMNG